ncbi:MAG: hypothetical protein ACLR5N_09260 [Haemophilus parainfluenzae]
MDAYYYVGNAYKRGEGVQQDSQKALKWLELAAEYQMSGAAWELAEIYRDGIGNVSQNLEKAQAFYLLAKRSWRECRTLSTTAAKSSCCAR